MSGRLCHEGGLFTTSGSRMMGLGGKGMQGAGREEDGTFPSTSLRDFASADVGLGTIAGHHSGALGLAHMTQEY